MKPISRITIWKMFFKTCICVHFFFPTILIAEEIDLGSLEKQVRNTEIAFAKTMADRNFKAFKTFVSEEAIFISGSSQARGRDQVAKQWEQFYREKGAPFSWRPETVAVLDSGNLALSTGPVFNAAEKLISYYSSIWRQEEPGSWRVIFDKGNKACD